MSAADSAMRGLLKRAPVIPVYTPGSVDEAVQVAQALLCGGLPVIEVTLRTPIAMAALKAMVDVAPHAAIGAGTVLTPAQLREVKAAGAAFAVSPGGTTALYETARELDFPFLPGIATASELMLGLQAGLDCFKFFPAAQSGGVALLSSFAGPFADVLFCPTGGITLQTAPDYLHLGNVACVGGSWITTPARLAAKDWPGIEAAAREAALLLR